MRDYSLKSDRDLRDLEIEFEKIVPGIKSGMHLIDAMRLILEELKKYHPNAKEVEEGK